MLIVFRHHEAVLFLIPCVAVFFGPPYVVAGTCCRCCLLQNQAGDERFDVQLRLASQRDHSQGLVSVSHVDVVVLQSLPFGTFPQPLLEARLLVLLLWCWWSHRRASHVLLDNRQGVIHAPSPPVENLSLLPWPVGLFMFFDPQVRRGAPWLGEDRPPGRLLDASRAARKGRHARDRFVVFICYVKRALSCGPRRTEDRRAQPSQYGFIAQLVTICLQLQRSALGRSPRNNTASKNGMRNVYLFLFI